MRITERAIILLVVLFCLLFYANRCPAIEVSVGYGVDVPVAAWQSDGLKCSIIQLELSKEFKSPWYGAVVLDRMHGKLNPTGGATGWATSGRVGIQKRLLARPYGNLRVSMFGGFGATLKGHMPEIGSSGIIGHFGVNLKYVMTNWVLGYEWSHFSDPLQSGDKGWNVQLVTIGRRF